MGASRCHNVNRYLYVQEPHKGTIEAIIMPRARPPACPSCSSHRSQRNGFRKTKLLGIRQIRLDTSFGVYVVRICACSAFKISVYCVMKEEVRSG